MFNTMHHMPLQPLQCSTAAAASSTAVHTHPETINCHVWLAAITIRSGLLCWVGTVWVGHCWVSNCCRLPGLTGWGVLSLTWVTPPKAPSMACPAR